MIVLVLGYTRIPQLPHLDVDDLVLVGVVSHGALHRVDVREPDDIEVLVWRKDRREVGVLVEPVETDADVNIDPVGGVDPVDRRIDWSTRQSDQRKWESPCLITLPPSALTVVIFQTVEWDLNLPCFIRRYVRGRHQADQLHGRLHVARRLCTGVQILYSVRTAHNSLLPYSGASDPPWSHGAHTPNFKKTYNSM